MTHQPVAYPVLMSEAEPITLTTPPALVPGIGRHWGRQLATMGLTNVGKLIAHLPSRHELLEAEVQIADITIGRIISVRGQVTATQIKGRGRRPRFEAVLIDETGRLDLVWFNALYLRNKVHPGMRLRVQGMARLYEGAPQLANPRFEILPEDDPEPPMRGEQVRPIYPASENVPSYRIESCIRAVLDDALPLIEDHLPESFRKERDLPSLARAYRMMHAPADEDEPIDARRRLAYDELLLLQLGVHMKRAHLRQALRSPAMRWSEAIDAHIRERFPFALTTSQDAVIKDIAADLSSDTPTNRLIQGDVGSGKTVVALYAMLMAVASGNQSALMAPTTLLADQHFASIGAMLEGSRVRVELLTGSTPPAEREAILARLALDPAETEGRAAGIDILIGTHALLTESVRFGSLGLAVIDEQHRFGVHQRAALRAKVDDERMTPHVLVMTATPIPRTLAITLFGDLDVSTIAELPPGRVPAATRLVEPGRSGEVYRHVAERLGRGGQAYVVVPAIDSQDNGVSDVTTVLNRLQRHELAGFRLAAMHGRLPRPAREHVMDQFRAGEIDALIATTVIEVGVDVPGASVMVIEHAERFGLAQLHQLRGRIGRGSAKSLCVLIAEPATDDARQRLAVLTETSDGFVIAEKDLELRGPGELFGTRQWGLPPLKVADLMRDRDLLALARRDAADWIARSRMLDAPDEQVLRRRLLKQYGPALGLGDVG